MNIRNTAIITLTALSLAPVAAFADRDRDRDAGTNRGDYDYARVTHVEPVYRTVRNSEPVQHCWTEEVTSREPAPRGEPRGTAGRTIVGGLIGGLVGSQFGGGRGRDAATVAGVLVGSAIANDSANRSNYRRDQERTQVRTDTVERCRTSHRTFEEEVIDGYRVSYVYNGQTYNTRMARDPGRTIRVWVSVRPAEG